MYELCWQYNAWIKMIQQSASGRHIKCSFFVCMLMRLCSNIQFSIAHRVCGDTDGERERVHVKREPNCIHSVTTPNMSAPGIGKTHGFCVYLSWFDRRKRERNSLSYSFQCMQVYVLPQVALWSCHVYITILCT